MTTSAGKLSNKFPFKETIIPFFCCMDNETVRRWFDKIRKGF